jgi:putative redox protein
VHVPQPHSLTAPAETAPAAGETMDVRFEAGERYGVTVRGHRFEVDQPIEAGGEDRAATPTELFLASLATCVAYYAGRYLTRHGHGREGLGVSLTYRLASDRPSRVAEIQMTVVVPDDLPTERWPALRAVVARCTVHNSITIPPTIRIELTT